MSNLAAPWILLILHSRQGIHGYELSSIVREQLADIKCGLNLSGLYRHLNTLEKRGMLFSEWDMQKQGRGPARRRYFITETGRQCLCRWVQTLHSQKRLIGKFLDLAAEHTDDSPGAITEKP